MEACSDALANLFACWIEHFPTEQDDVAVADGGRLLYTISGGEQRDDFLSMLNDNFERTPWAHQLGALTGMLSGPPVEPSRSGHFLDLCLRASRGTVVSRSIYRHASIVSSLSHTVLLRQHWGVAKPLIVQCRSSVYKRLLRETLAVLGAS